MKFQLARFLHPVATLTLAFALPAAARSAEPARAPGKLREMTTDRPDATESPFTIDVGHVQLEMDFANYTRDRDHGTRTVEWEAAPFNLRFGLTPKTEVGVFLTPYHRTTVTSRSGPSERLAGFGDTTFRFKLNFTGNDGDGAGTGLICNLKLPTARRGLSNGKCEGAVILPFSCDLPGGWGVGAMTEVDAVYTDENRFRPSWTNSITFSHDLIENLDAFFEITSTCGIGSHVATLNVGLTRALDRDTHLDGGVFIGLSHAAPDATFFAGISRRF